MRLGTGAVRLAVAHAAGHDSQRQHPPPADTTPSLEPLLNLQSTLRYRGRLLGRGTGRRARRRFRAERTGGGIVGKGWASFNFPDGIAGRFANILIVIP